MIELKSVHKPTSGLESMGAGPAVPVATPGSAGAATFETSRSLRHLVVSGRSGPIALRFEGVLGADNRVRILDTDPPPWRMICALRMSGPTGAGATGTGWFIGPRTVLTAGHCVFSNHFFGGWASSIEIIPGLLGAGAEDDMRPHGSDTSEQFSSVDRWVETEDPDFDIGCIHLEDRKRDVVGWFALAAPSPEELVSYLVNVSGYPGDRGGGNEQYFGSNRVLRLTERRVFYEVDTYGDQSGASVWIHESEGAPPLAVGIHAYGVGEARRPATKS